MGEPLVTPAELAVRFKISVSTLHGWRQEYDWPHVEFGRTVRFTEAQVEAITARHTVGGELLFLVPGQLPGQTHLSARRHQRRRAL